MEEVRKVRKRKGKYEVLVKWLGYAEADDTLEPINSMLEDMPGMVENHLYTPGERNLKRELPDLYF